MTFSGAIKPAPYAPEFMWNSVARRYIDPTTGRFVSAGKVRQALDRTLDGITAEMKAISLDLTSGKMSLAKWQTEMMALSKDANLTGAALERGGWYNMRQSDFGAVGAKVRGEYAYIDNFASQVASGEQPLDGTLWNRATLYGDQGRVTYYEFAAKSADEDEMDEERSRLNPADHCTECVDEHNRSWQPRGDVVPIGSRQCLSRCHCEMEYRNSLTGQTRTV